MIKVIYTECEGGQSFIGYINLTPRQIIRRLNKLRKAWLPHQRRLKPFVNITDYLPPLSNSIARIHFIWLPDGREWDVVNGMTYKKRSPHFRGPQDFQRMAKCLLE